MPALPTVDFICHDYGDAALLVDVLADSYDDRWSATQSLGQALRGAGLPGLVDVVASFQNVFVSFDPLVTCPEEIRLAITRLEDRPGPLRQPSQFVIPVVYGGKYGPDLQSVAAELSMTTESVIELHTSSAWIVRFIGPGGAPMMDGPPMPSSVRRLAEPRAKVSSGSVALSGQQSTIYAAASPGGWRLIGRTPAALFNLDREPHVPYRAGDSVTFARIEPAQWSGWTQPLVEGR